MHRGRWIVQRDRYRDGPQSFIYGNAETIYETQYIPRLSRSRSREGSTRVDSIARAHDAPSGGSCLEKTKSTAYILIETIDVLRYLRGKPRMADKVARGIASLVSDYSGRLPSFSLHGCVADKFKMYLSLRLKNN